MPDDYDRRVVLKGTAVHQNLRWDETWHRLRDWTNGQGRSERLAAQALLSEGYRELDPIHPLGGPDGGKDALCMKDGVRAKMAVYFPRGQQSFSATKKKFRDDLAAALLEPGQLFAFVTNQELTDGERGELVEHGGAVVADIYHLERITSILDKPSMAGVRKQFLDIEFVSTWPDAADRIESLEVLAQCIQSAVAAKVEILMQAGNRMILWLKPSIEPTRGDLPEVKTMLLSAACVVSGRTGIQDIEVGFSDTAELRHSVGGDGIGCWRVRFAADAVHVVAATKIVELAFWEKVEAVFASGDNLRVGQFTLSFSEFEARA